MPLPRRCAAALAVVVLAACSSGGPTTTGSDPGAAPVGSTTTAAAGPAVESPTSCGGNDPGIVRSICDGPASIGFDLADEHGELTGGTCSVTIAYLDVVVGTETDPSGAGARLDFVDLQLPVEPGTFDDGRATVVWDGVEHELAGATGSHDGRSGSVGGTLDDGRRLDATFTC